MRLELGTPVRCTDKAYGELADVVIDPIAKRVTHLVVRPSQQEALETRLVPIELAEGATRRRRSCSAARWKRSMASSQCRSTLTCEPARPLSAIRTGTSVSKTCSRVPTT